MTPARIEITVKLHDLPKEVTETSEGAKTFVVGTESGPRFEVTLSKKSFKRLSAAAAEWPQWLAIITGRFGASVGEGVFRLEGAGLNNVIERKAKPATSDVAAPKEDEKTAASEAKAPPLEPASTSKKSTPPKKSTHTPKPQHNPSAKPANLPRSAQRSSYRAPPSTEDLLPRHSTPRGVGGRPSRLTTKELWIARWANPPEVIVRRSDS